MYGTNGITWMKSDMKEWTKMRVRFGYGYGFMASLSALLLLLHQA